MSETIAFKPVYLQTNQGHGNARRAALKACSNELVALMDADDISLTDRFQLQLQRFLNNEDLSIVGGQISEFSGNENNITGIRRVPESHKEILQYAKKRCPMNQMSVMFKETAVDSAGGYLDWYCEEDYYLWLRMLEKGCLFENLPEILVNVRAGEGMSSRRGGWKYFKSEAKLQRYMLKQDTISIGQYLYNVLIRFGGEVILSNKLRTFAFKMFRARADSIEIDKVKEKEEREEMSNREAYPSFSVAVCVYGKDNAEWFDTALESIIINQTVKPSEVVLVVDGPVPKTIEKVIQKYSKICGEGTAPSYKI